MSLFSLNLFAILFNTDLWVTKSRHLLATFRRINTIILIILVLFVVTLVIVLHEHWCCYPLSFSIYQYTLGWCIAPTAPIFNHTDIVVPCNDFRYATWQWIFIALLAASATLFVISYFFSAYYFVTDMHADTIFTLDEINKHSKRFFKEEEKEKAAIVETFITELEEGYLKKLTKKEKDTYRSLVGTSPLTYVRAHILWFDPIAFVFHLPGFLYHKHTDWLGIGVRWGCHLLIAFLVIIYIFVSKDPWEERCCYPSTGRLHAANLGDCRDPDAFIYQGESTRTCDITTWTWQMYTEGMIGMLVLLVSCIMYVKSYIAVHTYATKQSIVYVWNLYAMIASLLNTRLKHKEVDVLSEFLKFSERGVLNDIQIL